MKIYGIGNDLTNIDRIKMSVKNKKFIIRMFNKSEIKKCNKLKKSANCFAKRFAAKEAFAKALGIGISKGLKFKEISVLNISSGKPTINLSGNTKKIVEKILRTKKYKTLISLSDDKSYGLATLLIPLSKKH